MYNYKYKENYNLCMSAVLWAYSMVQQFGGVTDCYTIDKPL